MEIVKDKRYEEYGRRLKLKTPYLIVEAREVKIPILLHAPFLDEELDHPQDGAFTVLIPKEADAYMHLHVAHELCHLKTYEEGLPIYFNSEDKEWFQRSQKVKEKFGHDYLNFEFFPLERFLGRSGLKMKDLKGIAVPSSRDFLANSVMAEYLPEVFVDFVEYFMIFFLPMLDAHPGDRMLRMALAELEFIARKNLKELKKHGFSMKLIECAETKRFREGKAYRKYVEFLKGVPEKMDEKQFLKYLEKYIRFRKKL